MGEGAAGERDASDRSAGLEDSCLGDNLPLAQICHQAVEAAQLEIAAEDDPHPLGLPLNHDDLTILAGVSEGNDAADPQPLAFGGGDLVADAFRSDLALELGKRQQNV